MKSKKVATLVSTLKLVICIPRRHHCNFFVVDARLTLCSFHKCMTILVKWSTLKLLRTSGNFYETEM
jgi:hypothetical protein